MEHNYKTNDPVGWGGDASRGSALGRPSIHGEWDGEPLTLRCKSLDAGGYDENGTYFGFGDPLYWVNSEDGAIDYMLRAKDRVDAKRQVSAEIEGATFAPDDCRSDRGINNNEVLEQLLEEEIESSCEDREVCEEATSNATLDDVIRQAAREFDAACLKAVEVWLGANIEKMHPDNRDIRSLLDIMGELRGGASYLYYMEHEDAGIGTWDGDWDHLFIDGHAECRDAIHELSDHVKDSTHETYQALKDALMNRACECIAALDERNMNRYTET